MNSANNTADILKFPPPKQRIEQRIPVNLPQFSIAGPKVGPAPANASVEELMARQKKLYDEYQTGFINQIAKELTISLYHRFVSLGFDVSTPKFEQDFTFLIETLKSTLYRCSGLNHPIQICTDEFFNVFDALERGESIDDLASGGPTKAPVETANEGSDNGKQE